nr:pro-resilin-like [Procambarus clarkii]
METPIEGLPLLYLRQTVALVVLVARAGSNPHGGYNYQEPVVQGPRYSSQYVYQWDVNDKSSGNFYGQREQRRGENTQGSYYVQLPGNRRLKVEYSVDDSGFRPVVTYGAGGQGSDGGQGYS